MTGTILDRTEVTNHQAYADNELRTFVVCPVGCETRQTMLYLSETKRGWFKAAVRHAACMLHAYDDANRVEIFDDGLLVATVKHKRL